jgi:hypothetical protein
MGNNAIFLGLAPLWVPALLLVGFSCHLVCKWEKAGYLTFRK